MFRLFRLSLDVTTLNWFHGFEVAGNNIESPLSFSLFVFGLSCLIFWIFSISISSSFCFMKNVLRIVCYKNVYNVMPCNCSDLHVCTCELRIDLRIEHCRQHDVLAFQLVSRTSEIQLWLIEKWEIHTHFFPSMNDAVGNKFCSLFLNWKRTSIQY